ncbi:MAG: class II aldolase/adducin family protein [Pseudomonadota bacterium]
MEALVNKYANKLVQSGLGKPSGPCQPLVGGLDDILVWNRTACETQILERVFSGLNINSLVFLRPVEPYAGLIQNLSCKALSSNGIIEPKDCETRTFLHDLPVISTFDPNQIIQILKKRKSVIIASDKNTNGFKGPAIIAHGTVSPEQGFVTISSVCFAGFIKFFTDYLENLQLGTATPADHGCFDAVLDHIQPLPKALPDFTSGPFSNEQSVYTAMIEAGLRTVEYDLVDSYFGNVSYCWNNTLYISQTGSSLDELSGCIDPVPLDNSTSAGLTASSELSAHLKTIEITGNHAILHGHPKFCVILSMDCDPIEKAACDFNGQCHIKCPKKRFVNHSFFGHAPIGQIPIVSGEVGTGPTGLCNTLPKALSQSNSAIVYGHGLFTTGKTDFFEPFKTMLEVETLCRDIYFKKVKDLRK